MNKRPWSVSLLVIFYSGWLLLDILFLVYGKAGLFGNPLLKSPWSGQPPLLGKAIPLFICVVMFLVITGLWYGKSWGRNLAFAVNLVFMFSMFFGIASVLKILSPETRLFGWHRVQLYLDLLFLGVFAFAFYFGLRPEVGRFCGIYPEKDFKP